MRIFVKSIQFRDINQCKVIPSAGVTLPIGINLRSFEKSSCHFYNLMRNDCHIILLSKVYRLIISSRRECNFSVMSEWAFFIGLKLTRNSSFKGMHVVFQKHVLRHNQTFHCGLTAVIGEKIHQWTSCGTWPWPLSDGLNSTDRCLISI